MWRTMRTKSSVSEQTASALREKAIAAQQSNAANMFSLVLVIVVMIADSLLLLRLRLLRLRFSSWFLEPLLVAARLAGDAKVTFEFTKLRDVDRPHKIDHRQLRGFGHKNGQAGDVIPLFHHKNFVVLVRFKAAALHDSLPAWAGELGANAVHIGLRILARTFELKVLDVDSLQVLDNVS